MRGRRFDYVGVGSGLALESGTWIIVGCVVVAAMMVVFRRMPTTVRGDVPESLGKRWFGG